LYGDECTTGDAETQRIIQGCSRRSERRYLDSNDKREGCSNILVANAGAAGGTRITTGSSAGSALVVPADEELVAAREVEKPLRASRR
jgi:hypothetical protein